MRSVTYRKVDVDGIGVSYREAGPSSCCTVSPPPVTCFAISSRNSQTGFDSSLPICAGADRFRLRRGKAACNGRLSQKARFLRDDVELRHNRRTY